MSTGDHHETPHRPQPPGAQSYLVLGGNGFVGTHILRVLLGRGETRVTSLSRSLPQEKKRVKGVRYERGDVGDEGRVCEVIKEVGATVVYHTVSPTHNAPLSTYRTVNIVGTSTVISACKRMGVPVLVYTSSSGVVWTGKPASGVTEEEAKAPEQGLEGYSATKAMGERLVLEADTKEGEPGGLRTAALRPHAIVGPGDQQAMWRFAENYESGQYHFQVGDGKNLFSTVSVTDVARAHLLASDALLDPTRAPLVGGQAFFITDNVPIPFYHYPHLVWRELGAPENFWRIVLPKWLCLFFALFTETWHAWFGGHTVLTKFVIMTVTTEQWYSCEKAERLLGYRPTVTLEEAVKDLVKWWKEEGAAEHAAHQKSLTLR